MIPNITTGSSFSGALRYDLNEEKGYLLETNCASSNADVIAAEMDVQAASSRCKKPVHHVSLRCPGGEKLSDHQWRQVREKYMHKMQFNDTHQFAATRHTDKIDGDHIHIVINRVDGNGKLDKDFQLNRRSQQACREIEKEMGLQRLEDHQIQDSGRMNKVKSDLRDSIKESRGKDLNALKESLEKQGYDLKLHSNSGGVYGASIQAKADGKTWKMSEIKSGGLKQVQKELAGGLMHSAKEPKVASSAPPAAPQSSASPSAGGGSSSSGHRSLEGVTDQALRDLIIRVNANGNGAMQANLGGREQEL